MFAGLALYLGAESGCNVKRRFKILLLVLIAAFLPAYVFAATYSGTITFSNTSATAYTSQTGFSVAINNSYLAANGYMLASGLDTRVSDSGTVIQSLVASDRTMFVNTILANQTKSLSYTFGNSALADMPIIVGNAGSAATNDDADIELGNNFNLTVSGYIRTNVVGNLVNKSGAVTIATDGAGNITATVVPNAAIVDAVNGGNNAVDSLNHTVNLPAGIASGDLLLVFFTVDENPVVTFPAGWTQIFNDNSGANLRYAAFYRVSNGTEGASITVTTDSAQMSAHTSYRIRHYTGVPESAVSVGGLSISPNPPVLGPAWGAALNAWFAVTGYDVGTTTVTGYPANYTNDQRNDRANDATGVGQGTAWRSLNAANDNPGTYTLSGAETWLANTVAVQMSNYVLTAAVATGLHTISLQSDGTTLSLVVDAVPAATTTFSTSVIDNANDWAWIASNTSPYTDYITIDVGGMSVLQYQPVTIVQGQTYSTGTAAFTNGSPNVAGTGTLWTSAMVGSAIKYDADNIWHIVSSVTNNTALVLTTNYGGAGGGAAAYTMGPRLPDRDATGGEEMGIITWGANPAGISTVFSGLSPTGTSVSSSSINPENPSITGPTSGLGGQKTGVGTSGFNPDGSEAIPGAGLVQGLVQNINAPNPNPGYIAPNMTTGWVWMVVFAMVAIIAMMLVSRTGSVMLMGLTGIGIMAAATQAGIFEYWVLILAVLIGAVWWIMQRVQA